MLHKELKCPYCELHESRIVWVGETGMNQHINTFNDVEFRTIEALLSSWKVLGMYEERLV